MSNKKKQKKLPPFTTVITKWNLKITKNLRESLFRKKIQISAQDKIKMPNRLSMQ